MSSGARARQWRSDSERELNNREHAVAGDAVGRKAWPITLSESDLIVGGRGHEDALVLALKEARSSLFVASAFLNAASVEKLKDSIRDALRRGVNVDLLWGYAVNEEQGAAPLETLKRLAYEAKRDGDPGLLRFNRTASGSHAKLVLFDRASGMEALLGSYNWMSAVGANERADVFNVSIRLREPGIVAELCGCAAGLWAGSESEALSSTPDRWRSAAAELEQVAAGGADGPSPEAKSGGTSARLVFDREHEGLLRELAAGAQQRLIVLSHRLGPVAESRLVMASEAKPPEYCVLYGHCELDEMLMASLGEMIHRSGGTLAHLPNVHAKVVVSDASACISSYNFLSADPFGRSRRAREIGVCFEGGGVASWLAGHVTAAARVGERLSPSE